MSGSIKDKGDAFVQLESIMLRQMLQSSGAFRAGSTPGSQLRTDMFIETLADAVAKAGGLGIGRMLERQLGHVGESAGKGMAEAHGGAIGLPTFASSLTTFAPTRPAAAEVSGIDDLDDPNSDAPLPEDPTASSIDDFQPTKAASPRGNSTTQSVDHQPGHLAMPKSDAHARTIFVGRALNSYRERAEETLGGTLIGVSKEKAP